MAKSKNYCVEVDNKGVTFKYGFKTGADYGDLKEKLGVTDLNEDGASDAGVLYGINRPKPPRAIITYQVGPEENGVTRTVKRFCSTENEASTLVGDNITIRGNTYPITAVMVK